MPHVHDHWLASSQRRVSLLLWIGLFNRESSSRESTRRPTQTRATHTSTRELTCEALTQALIKSYTSLAGKDSLTLRYTGNAEHDGNAHTSMRVEPTPSAQRNQRKSLWGLRCAATTTTATTTMTTKLRNHFGSRRHQCPGVALLGPFDLSGLSRHCVSLVSTFVSPFPAIPQCFH